MPNLHEGDQPAGTARCAVCRERIFILQKLLHGLFELFYFWALCDVSTLKYLGDRLGGLGRHEHFEER